MLSVNLLSTESGLSISAVYIYSYRKDVQASSFALSYYLNLRAKVPRKAVITEGVLVLLN